MSFLEDEIDGQYQKKKCNQVVGFQGFSLKENGSEYHKYHEGDNLLDYFELHERKGTSGTLEADSISRHLGTIFEKCYCPTQEYYTKKSPVGDQFTSAAKFEVAIPGQSHKTVGYHQQ